MKEIRFASSDLRVAGDRTIEGFAIVYDSWSLDLGGFRERVMPGSVEIDPQLRALVDHDSGKLLATMRSGTLTVEDRAGGLWIRATLPPTTYAADLKALMDAGMMDQQSFSFIVRNGPKGRGEKWATGSAGLAERTLTAIRVGEVSIVGIPAYEATSAALRSAQHAFEEYRSSESERQQNGGLPLALAEIRLALMRGLITKGGR